MRTRYTTISTIADNVLSTFANKVHFNYGYVTFEDKV